MTDGRKLDSYDSLEMIKGDHIMKNDRVQYCSVGYTVYWNNQGT